MATKKDLVEAHAFSRRRLVTAFVSGAPGGREVEPTRPMRAVLGGVALSVLVLAGGAVAGLLAPKTDPSAFAQDNNLVASRTGGDLYLVQKSGDSVVLRPFTNAMSARLLLGDKDTLKASAADIAEEDIGPQIGISDPPAQIAPTDRLVQTGWTACTRAGAGIVLDVESTPPGRVVAGGAQAVTVEGRTYLITDEGRAASSAEPDRAAAFPLQGGRADLILDRLQLTDDPVAVDRTWLALFAEGDPVRRGSFAVGAARQPASYAAAAGAPSLRTGDLATLSGVTYLATQSGLAQLTPFAASAYQAISPRVPTLPVTSVPQVASGPAFPDSWPTGAVTPAEGNACARLVAAPGEAPTVRVASDLGSSSRLDDVPAGQVQARVQPGYGALVQAGTFGSARGSGTFLVNADGKSYGIADPTGTTTGNLGYAGVEQPVVPESWLKLLDEGSELSAELAGQSPRSQGR